MTAQTQGEFHFMQPDTEPSLYRNGRVKMERDPNGDTASSSGVELGAYTLPVINAREMSDAPTCERNGFQLCQRPLADDSLDFMDNAAVLADYYPQCAALVAELTGARAFAFDHNVRSAGGLADKASIRGGQNVQGPAHVVHGDYTLRSGPERLQQLSLPPEGNDTLLEILGERSLVSPEAAGDALEEGGRFAIINVWRNIDHQPVATHPMALCDGQTVQPEDLVVFEIHYPNRIGENYFSRFSEAHRLYYYPGMTRDEALIIKQWDSAGPLARSDGERADSAAHDAPCTFSFHSAFNDPDTPPDAPDRWSIEVRCLVIYD